MLLYAIMVVVCWVGWFRYIGPQIEESNLYKDSLEERMKNQKGWFGANQRVSFDGMRQIGAVDRRLVPGSEVPGVEGRRLIIVGDIHGCIDERKHLLPFTLCSPTIQYPVLDVCGRIPREASRLLAPLDLYTSSLQ